MKMVRFGSVVTKQNETVKPDIDNVATRCIELEHIESATGQLLGTIDFSNTTSTKNAFSAGDCLFGKLRPYLRKYHQPTFDGVCSSEIWVLRSKTPNLEQDYIHLLLQSQRLTKAANIVSGTKMPRANWGLVSNTIVPLPTNYEQKIAISLFRTLDRCIQTTKSLIATKREQKRGLMQELLTGKRRFPEFGESVAEGVSGKETKIGWIPEDWDVMQLGDLGSTYGGLSNKNKDHFGSGKPYITYMNVFSNSKTDPHEVGLVKIAEGENQNQVKYGDVLFTTSSETQNEVGMSSVVLDEIEETYLNSFCFGYRLNNFDTVPPDYLRYALRCELFRKQVYSLAQGATRYNLSKTRLMHAFIPVPSIKESKKIFHVLDEIDKEIILLRSYADQLCEQKRGLMQKLFSGELDLSELKSIATEVPA